MNTINSYCVGEMSQALLQENGVGKIVGAFHHGIYFSCHGHILLIHDEKYGEIPCGVGVSHFETLFPFDICRELPLVRWDRGRLFFEHGVIISCRQYKKGEKRKNTFSAQICQRFIESSERIIAEEEMVGTMGLCLQMEGILRARYEPLKNQTGFEHYVPVMYRALNRFFNAYSQLDVPEGEKALLQMIGLGAGLTPSADDWLIGFMYVAQRVECSPEMAGFTRQICICILRMAGIRTNRYSASYLEAVADGYYYEILENAFLNPGQDTFSTLFSVGSSSGHDMTAGMLFAAKFFLMQHC